VSLFNTSSPTWENPLAEPVVLQAEAVVLHAELMVLEAELAALFQDYKDTGCKVLIYKKMR